ncbi:MAG TPA: PspA/IM30 family protein [Thermoanaerobaculia bacterium]|jgi:phage shock protein A|nr:PspA/IM30 family protein [Thermoanaerobaculia bacterium]
MFDRLVRMLKSWVGFFISFGEDPEVMLQQSIEEMRSTLPRLNQILITTRATVIRLEQEREELERKEKQLISSIQAALKEGSPEARRIAEDDASTLQQLRGELTATREQITAAQNAFQNAQITVEDIKSKLRTKIEQSKKAIQESKKATILKGAASALAELDTYGTASTADKYLDEIKQHVAESKAAVEVATGGLDVERIKTERKARQLQAQSILSEFEVEMGLKKPDAVREAAPFPTESTPSNPEATPQKVGGA